MSDQLDERRDRYAAAMAKRDGHEWPTEFEDDEHDYRRRADAVIAVADGEITRALDAEASNAARYLFERDAERDENARLRAAASSAPADQPSIRDTMGPADGQQKMRFLDRLYASTTPVDETADQNLRDRIRRAICEASGFEWDDDGLEPDEYGEHADAVLAVLPAPATTDVREIVNRLIAHAQGFQDVLDESDRDPWARLVRADIDVLRTAIAALPEPADGAETVGYWQAKLAAVTDGRDSLQRENTKLRRELASAERIRENADFHLGQEMARRQRAEKELRRTADEARQTGEGADCRTPETHNWGCGCPSDVTAAIASCPGYETSPSPCRCPCYGCKHHCGAHNPGRMADEAGESRG